MITFTDKQSATEYLQEKEAQGYSAKITEVGGHYTVDVSRSRRSKDEHNPDDLRELREKDERLEAVRQVSGSGNGKGQDAAKWLFKGLGTMKESLLHPEHKRRMRISQMAGKHAPIRSDSKPNPISGREAGLRRHYISNAPIRGEED